MDVRCERCRAQYTFEEAQLTPVGVTVQCTVCGHVFQVTRKDPGPTTPVRPDEPWTALPPLPTQAPVTASAAAPIPPPVVASPASRWTIRLAGGQTLGFTELSTLQRWIVERRVSREDQVTQGDGSWVSLGTVAELQSFFEVVEAADRAEGRTTARYPAVPTPSPSPATSDSSPGLPLQQPQRGSTAGSVRVDQNDAYRPAPGASRRSRTPLVAVLLLLVAGAAVAYVFAPGLFGQARPPDPAPAPLPVLTRPPEPLPPAPRPVAEPRPEPTPEPKPTGAPPPAAVAPEPAKETRPPGTRTLLAEANRLREASKVAQALELYGRVVSQEPENVEALTGRGLCYLDLDQLAPAEASLQEALRRSPAQPDALLGLAETYRTQGRKAEAIAQFERYLAAHPGGDEAAAARNAINQLKE